MNNHHAIGGSLEINAIRRLTLLAKIDDAVVARGKANHAGSNFAYLISR